MNTEEETCEYCQRNITRQEEAYVLNGMIACEQCDKKLRVGSYTINDKKKVEELSTVRNHNEKILKEWSLSHGEPVMCLHCEGSGKMACLMCHGEGKVERPVGRPPIEVCIETCDFCNGTGIEDCIICDGKSHCIPGDHYYGTYKLTLDIANFVKVLVELSIGDTKKPSCLAKLESLAIRNPQEISLGKIKDELDVLVASHALTGRAKTFAEQLILTMKHVSMDLRELMKTKKKHFQ